MSKDILDAELKKEFITDLKKVAKEYGLSEEKIQEISDEIYLDNSAEGKLWQMLFKKTIELKHRTKELEKRIDALEKANE